jgi:hypothetical protein
MSFKQAVDQVQVAWTATPSTNREFARQMGFRAGGKSRSLFMSCMYPFDIATLAQRVRYAVEAIADNTVDAADTG